MSALAFGLRHPLPRVSNQPRGFALVAHLASSHIDSYVCWAITTGKQAARAPCATLIHRSNSSRPSLLEHGFSTAVSHIPQVAAALPATAQEMAEASVPSLDAGHMANSTARRKHPGVSAASAAALEFHYTTSCRSPVHRSTTVFTREGRRILVLVRPFASATRALHKCCSMLCFVMNPCDQPAGSAAEVAGGRMSKSARGWTVVK